MNPIPVEVYKNYNTFFDYVSLETLLVILFSGLATLGGAYLGAKKAGEKSVEAVQKQIEYSSKEKQRNLKVRQEKYDVYLKIHLNQLLKSASRISFFMDLHSMYNPYNVDPLEEMERILSVMNETMKQLFSIDPSYISLNNYKLLGNINEYIKKIDNYYKSYLATEEEEANSYFSEVKNQADRLVLIIKENSSTSQLEDTD